MSKCYFFGIQLLICTIGILNNSCDSSNNFRYGNHVSNKTKSINFPTKKSVVFNATLGYMSVDFRFFSTIDTFLLFPDLRNDLTSLKKTYTSINEVKAELEQKEYDLPLILVEFSSNNYEIFSLESKTIRPIRNANMDFKSDELLEASYNSAYWVTLKPNKEKIVDKVFIYSSLFEKMKNTDSLRFHYVSLCCTDDNLSTYIHITTNYISFKRK